MNHILNRYIKLIPITITLAVFLVLIYWGFWGNFVQYRADCPANSCFFHYGDTQSSLITAIYYQYWGSEHWFIQEYPLEGDKFDFFLRPSLYYTHNVNLGAFVIYFFGLLGFTTIMGPAIVSMVAYCAGIFLSFRFADRATGSRLIGNWFGFFMASDVLYNLSSGMNVIHAWHWFGMFGVLLAAVELARAFSIGYSLLLFFASLVCFSIGYDFSAVVCGIGVAIGITYGKLRADKIRVCVIVLSSFIGIFLLRQVQVIAALGFSVWSTDFFYTFGLKIPGEFRWFQIPTEKEIALWYADNKLGRGGTALYSLTDFMNLKFIISELSTWRRLYLFPILLLTGVFASIYLLKRRQMEWHKIKILPVFMAGLIFGMIIFFGHIWGYFFRFGFPLVTVPVYLAQAIAVGLIYQILKPKWGGGSSVNRIIGMGHATNV